MPHSLLKHSPSKEGQKWFPKKLPHHGGGRVGFIKNHTGIRYLKESMKLMPSYSSLHKHLGCVYISRKNIRSSPRSLRNIPENRKWDKKTITDKKENGKRQKHISKKRKCTRNLAPSFRAIDWANQTLFGVYLCAQRLNRYLADFF